MITLACELGALTEIPGGCWESHSRGKNWMAAIHKDPRAPGGLGRAFWEKAKGDYYYLIPANLNLPCPIEIGADYYTGSGHKQPTRWYGVIVESTADHITIEECGTASAAIKRAAITIQSAQ